MRKALLAVALWAIPSLAQAQGVPIQDLPLATTPLSSSDLFAVTQGNVFHKLPGTSLGLAAGLGTMSTQNANAVAITGGTISGVTIAGNVTGHASLDLALTGGTMSGNIAMGGNDISGGGMFAATTLTGTLSTAAQPNITSVGTLTGLTVTGSFTATGLVSNADLANPSTAVNGQTCTLGSTCTVTATASNALTFGTHLTGGSFNGSAPVTLGTDATSANTVSTIVARDGSGNFAAGAITLTGNPVYAISGATTNGNCVEFGTGSILTDTGAPCSSGGGGGSVTSVGLTVPATSIFGVTGSPITTAGTLGITTTGTSGGIPYFSSTSQLTSSALLASHGVVYGGGAGSAPVTTAAGTNGQILTGQTGAAPAFETMSGDGTFSAAGVLAITNLSGVTNASLANSGLAHSTISGVSLGSNLATLTYGTHLTNSAGASTYNGSAASTLATDATNANTASTIVARDASGNFTAGTITATLTGGASLDLPLTGGTMSGDIAMGGHNISGGGTVTATTLAGTLSTAAQPNITSVGTLAGLTVTGSLTATGLVTNADLAHPATTVNGQTCTLGSTCTVTATAGSALTFGTHLTGTSYDGSAPITIATDATSANTNSTIVARDGSGNFTAGTITASLTGHASLDCTLTGCAAHVATNAALTAASTVTYPNGVWRDDYSAALGAPPLWYVPSGSACSLNAGNGDNGSQVKSSDSKCWLAQFPAGGADIRQWGADSTGVVASNAAFTAVFALPSAISIAIPKGTFNLSCPVAYTTTSAISLKGVGKGLSVIKLDSGCTPSADYMEWRNPAQIVHIEGITLDLNTPATGSTFGAGLAFDVDGTNNLLAPQIVDVEVLNFGSSSGGAYGIRMNVGTSTASWTNPLITRSRVTKTVADGATANQCIATGGSGGSDTTADGNIHYSVFTENVCVNSGMQIDGDHGYFAGNDISGWAFGTGIFTVNYKTVTVSPPTPNHDNVFVGNNIHDSPAGYDVSTTVAGCVENNTYRSIWVGNIMHHCGGEGFRNYGFGTAIQGGAIYDNAKTTTISGNYRRVGVNAVNGGREVYMSGNLTLDNVSIFDDGAGTQLYAYGDDSGIDGPVSITGGITGVTAPISQGSAQGTIGGDIWQAVSSTITCNTGTITTGSAVMRYQRQPFATSFVLEIYITTNGTCAGDLIATLPVAADPGANTLDYSISGFSLSTGIALTGGIAHGTPSSLQVRKYDATYPGADATVLVVQGKYPTVN